mmetsp:Transcript_25751/g.55791  ORF Transcript_25751/g.55791 Transcript_25751/m.55791 type:complete len:101 (-) Transcript_25751:288-590(-)
MKTFCMSVPRMKLNSKPLVPMAFMSSKTDLKGCNKNPRMHFALDDPVSCLNHPSINEYGNLMQLPETRIIHSSSLLAHLLEFFVCKLIRINHVRESRKDP